jgi:hypothetical protein
VIVALGFGGLMSTSSNDLLLSTFASSDSQIDNNATNYLFVLSAMSGSLTPTTNNNTENKDANQTHTLTLSNVSSSTIAFSDRPLRIVKQFDTQDFVNNWTTGQDSFRTDPPNAALAINTGNQENVAIFELLNPVYDKENKTIRYDVIELDVANAKGEGIELSEIGTKNNVNPSNLSGEFGLSTLFIDAGCSPWDPRC